MVIPLVRNIKMLSYQIQSESIDRGIESTQMDKLPDLKKEWSDYEGRESLLNVVLGQQDQVGFIENIESIAQTSGNKIDLKIEDGVDKPTFDTRNAAVLKTLTYPNYLPIQISLEGNYAGLVKFIHLLENSQFYVNILSISAVKDSPNDNGNQNPFASAPTDSASANNNAISSSELIKTDIDAIVYTQKQ